MIRIFSISALIALTFLTSCSSSGNFATGTIDYGIVVRDAQKSIAFYKAIGFKELPSFSVPKEVTGSAGLLDYKDAKIYVMSLNGAATDTKVKLMQLPGSHKMPDQTFIDSTYGVSYHTIFVRDLKIVIDSLKANNIKILAKGPVDLTSVGFAPNFLLSVKDPDGNFIEFVGPILK